MKFFLSSRINKENNMKNVNYTILFSIFIFIINLNFSFAQTNNFKTSFSFFSVNNSTVIDYFKSHRSEFVYNNADSLTEMRVFLTEPDSADELLQKIKRFYNTSGYRIYELNMADDTMYYIHRDILNRDTLTIYANSNKISKSFYGSDPVAYEQIYYIFDTVAISYQPIQKHAYSYDNFFRIQTDTVYNYVIADSSWNPTYYLRNDYDLYGNHISIKSYPSIGNGNFSLNPYDCDTLYYNANNKLIMWISGNCTPASTELSRNYSYDIQGNLVEEIHFQDGYMNCPDFTSYKKESIYDDTGTLTRENILRVQYSIPCNLTGSLTEQYWIYSTASSLEVMLFTPDKFKTSCSDSLRPVYSVVHNADEPVSFSWNHPQLSGIASSAVELSPEAEIDLSVNVTDNNLDIASDTIHLFNHLLDAFEIEAEHQNGNIVLKCINQATTLRIDSLELNLHKWYYNGTLISGSGSSNSINIILPGTVLCKSVYKDGSGCPNIAAISLLDDLAEAEMNSDPAYAGQPFASGPVIFNNSLNRSDYQYEWYRNNLEITGITDSFLVASLPGNYYFIVTNSTGCNDTSVIREITNSDQDIPEGIYYNNVNSTGNFEMFIDPAIININSNISLEIINATGQVLINKKVNSQYVTLDISHFSHGLYYLRIFQNDQLLHRGKLIF